jgi:hypothetical protein
MKTFDYEEKYAISNKIKLGNALFISNFFDFKYVIFANFKNEIQYVSIFFLNKLRKVAIFVIFDAS